MPDIFYIVSRWWKQILAIVVVSLVVVATVLFLLPSKYLSTTTALPASTYLKDKGSIFSNNLQQLYPVLGIPDDLDMIVGTGQLDTPYLAVAKDFNLYDHYQVKEQGDAAVYKAAFILKKNAKVYKSDYGELKVKVWDTDKKLAAQLADAIMHQLQSIHEDVNNSNNMAVLASLKAGKEKLESTRDNSGDGAAAANNSQGTFLSDRVQQYDKLISEYQLIADTKTPALIVVERAKAANWPDKPKKALWLTVTFVLSVLFALLLALILERRKQIPR